MSSELVDIFTRTTLDFLAADGELEHDAAVLALLFADLGRRHLIHSLASGALYLLWARDKLQHAAAVVADEMGAGHRGDTCSD